MNERLRMLYQAARNDQSVTYSYISYCNTHIAGEVKGQFEVRIERFRPARRDHVFDVRNISLNVFLDRIAEWLVTGEVSEPVGPTDPLEW